MSVYGQLPASASTGYAPRPTPLSEHVAYSHRPYVSLPSTSNHTGSYQSLAPQYVAPTSQATPIAVGVSQHKVLAERYKTKVCRNYLETGACPYEFRCMFAHGDHELRTTEMNLRDGLTTEDAIRHYKRIMQYKALEELAGIAQPPDYESTLSGSKLLDEAAVSSPCEDNCGCVECYAASASRNSSIAMSRRLSSQLSFEQLSAAPSQCYQNNPYAWRSIEDVPEEEAIECRNTETDSCQCAECLYQHMQSEARAQQMQPRLSAPTSNVTLSGPYRSPAIARTFAEHGRRVARAVPESVVYVRQSTAFPDEVQMP